MKQWWEELRFRLFGETNILFWWYGGAMALVVAFWAAIIYIVAHFAIKYW